MNLFVETSVWQRALRRDDSLSCPEVELLVQQLESGGPVFTTGIVLQELLQGFSGANAHRAIVERFAHLPFVVPDRGDHIRAAGLRNVSLQEGMQISTVDALLAQLCVRHGLVMLTTDQDFEHMARHTALKVWGSQNSADLRSAAARWRRSRLRSYEARQ